MQLCTLAIRPSHRATNVRLLYALLRAHHVLKEVLPLSASASASASASSPSPDSEAKAGTETETGTETGAEVEALALQRQQQLLALTGRYMQELHLDQQGTYASAADAITALRAAVEKETDGSGRGTQESSSSSSSSSSNNNNSFSYQEEDGAEEFFVPCVWAALLRGGCVNICLCCVCVCVCVALSLCPSQGTH